MIRRAAIYALVGLALVAIVSFVVLEDLPHATPLPDNVYGYLWMHLSLVGAAIALQPAHASVWLREQRS